MVCPYCDSLLEEEMNTSTCPCCGADLEVFLQRERPAPPLGVYKQPFETLEIQETGMRFYKKFLWIVTDRFIPYEEVDRICFVPGGKELGFLCVRERNAKNHPLLHTAKKSFGDPTSIAFGSYFNDNYQRIYEFLQTVCKRKD